MDQVGRCKSGYKGGYKRAAQCKEVFSRAKQSRTYKGRVRKYKTELHTLYGEGGLCTTRLKLCKAGVTLSNLLHILCWIYFDE